MSPTRRSLQRPKPPSDKGAPPPRRPSLKSLGKPAPSDSRRASTNGPPGHPIQRPDRARRQRSAPPIAPQQLRGSGSKRPGEVRPGSAPGDKNSRPIAPDKQEKNKRRSTLGSIRKATTKLKASVGPAGYRPVGAADGGEVSPNSSHSSRDTRSSGARGVRQRASQRDPTRKLLSSSTTRSSAAKGARKQTTGTNQNRARPSRGIGRAESAAWRLQPIREEHVEKRLNPSAYPSANPSWDVDNLMKDIDLLFSLSTFEGQEKQAKQKADGTAAPANPSPRKDGSDNDDEVQSLLATAKIKYKLGQLSSTLKKDEKTSRFPRNADPLLIDKDGFMVTESTGSEPTPNDVFEADFAAAFGTAPDEKGEKKRKPKGSELLAAKRRELQADQQKLRQSGLKRSGGAIGVLTVDDNQDNKTFMTTDEEKNVRDKVMALAAGQTAGAVVLDIDKGERTFSAFQYDDDDDDMSKIDAVEAATKERIKMLRRVVAEKASQPSASDNKAGRGDVHQPDDDELTTTLDFVEQETMKQISRLRKRYKSREN